MSYKKVLIDTDIGPDCDDVAALAMLNIYANQGLCKILGIGHCTSNPYGAGTVDAICRYYGQPDINVSTYSGKDFLTDEKCMIYNKYITTHLENRYQTSQPEDAVRMYRRILAEQEDASVDFIAIGPLNNLSNLLDSEADAFSPMSGTELVKKKVKRLIAMAGIFESPVAGITELSEQITGKKISDTAEYNVVCDIKAAQNVAEHWPTPKIYLGFEAGLLETGALLHERLPEDHPVRIAYKLYTEHGVRYSWDLLTVEYAIIDDCKHFELSQAGHVRFDDEGKTIWQESAGSDRYVVWAEDAGKIVNDIDHLLITQV